MKVLIGCPVRSREWVMSHWLMHSSLAADIAGVDIEYVFVMSKEDPTLAVIEKNASAPFHVLDSQERVERDERHWNHTRYREMTRLRNWLLAEVRQREPDLFLSLDSDILLHPDALVYLLQSVEHFDAVGGKCWMTDTTDACSYIQLVNSHGFHRPDVRSVIPVDVIMAIKLMTPSALAVDYIFDSDGEDVGWSRQATKAGLKLGFDGRVCSKHVMARLNRNGTSRLTTVDNRCGF